eukprot:6212400-Pleurochrysis_carterae.AAC.2
MSVRSASLRSLRSTSPTVAPMSSFAAPGVVRRAAAASRRRSSTSSMSFLPTSIAAGRRPPSAGHARRANSTRWKAGEWHVAPPPASTCSTSSSAARCPSASRMSAAAASVSMRPQRPRPSVVPAKVPARVSAASGLCPPSNLTTGANSRST